MIILTVRVMPQFGALLTNDPDPDPVRMHGQQPQKTDIYRARTHGTVEPLR